MPYYIHWPIPCDFTQETVPQVEVTFDIDAIGILNVSALDKTPVGYYPVS